MLILHSRCDQSVLSKNSLSTVNQSSRCSQDVITGFQVPLPPVNVRSPVEMAIAVTKTVIDGYAHGRLSPEHLHAICMAVSIETHGCQHWGRVDTYPVGTLWVCCEFWSNSPSHYPAGMWWVLLKSTHRSTQWVLFEWNPWVRFKGTHQITQRVLFERTLRVLSKSTRQFDQNVPSRFFSKYP